MTKKEWYNPRSIRFTRAQVKWLISQLPLLRNGSYPRNPKESGYVDTGIKSKQFKAGASFEVPAGIAAELDIRIQRAGVDGLMLEFLYAFDPDDEVFIIEHMAQALNLGRKEVSQRIRNALYYVSGSNRKATTYNKYLAAGHKYLST